MTDPVTRRKKRSFLFLALTSDSPSERKHESQDNAAVADVPTPTQPPFVVVHGGVVGTIVVTNHHHHGGGSVPLGDQSGHQLWGGLA